MIKELNTPEVPTRPNTHEYVSMILLNFEPDGTARVTYHVTKGYMEDGVFVADTKSREDVSVEGLTIPASISPAELVEIVKKRKAEIEAERVKADLEAKTNTAKAMRQEAARLKKAADVAAAAAAAKERELEEAEKP